MKTLQFISLNSCFVSICVIEDLRMIIEISSPITIMQFFFQIPGLIKLQSLENEFLTLHVLKNRWFTNRFKTDKKTFAAEY